MSININKRNARINEIRTMNNGLKAKIIDYRSCLDIDVEFENGEKVINIQYDAFKRGGVKCPLIINKIDNYIHVLNANISSNFEFTIDAEDEYILKFGLWSPDAYGYAENKNGGKLHRLIMNAPDGMAVDHINGDITDNRKSNLRICVNSENLRNRGAQRNNKSGYKGVSWHKPTGKWVAMICINKKRKYLGVFINKKDAAIAYNEASIKYHGEFAYINKI